MKKMKFKPKDKIKSEYWCIDFKEGEIYELDDLGFMKDDSGCVLLMNNKALENFIEVIE